MTNEVAPKDKIINIIFFLSGISYHPLKLLVIFEKSQHLEHTLAKTNLMFSSLLLCWLWETETGRSSVS